MNNGYLHTFIILFVTGLLVLSCGTKKPPEKKEEKAGENRKGVQVFELAGNGEVFTATGAEVSQATVVIPSVSVYDWMDRLKDTLSREPLQRIDEACMELTGIGQTDPKSLEVDVKVDNKCASLPEGEPSHTDPSPLDDTGSWLICQPADSGVDGGEPGGEGPGGSGPSANADNTGGEGGSSELSGTLQNILCTPAVGERPDVDPRIVYPAPDQVDAVVAELAPCIKSFCPWKLIPIVPPVPQDPTEPIDPSPDDDTEIDESIKEKLPCDQFAGLCEPDITLISKNDLIKGDSGEGDDLKESEEWEDCDGHHEETGMQEVCSVGDVGNDDADWKQCSYEGREEGGVVCVTHLADPDEDKGESEYSVTVNPNGASGSEATSDEMDNASSQSEFMVNFNYSEPGEKKNCTASGQSAEGKKITTNIDCK